jgi:hypothetical protein
MPNRYPHHIDRLLRRTVAAWQNIDPSAQIGGRSVADLEAILTQGEQIKAEMDSLETQLTELRNRRDALYVSGWDIIKRLRSWIKGHYGDDSSEYEMVGGTRLSERKPRARKKAQATPPAQVEQDTQESNP